jgi:hypothetical protein
VDDLVELARDHSSTSRRDAYDRRRRVLLLAAIGFAGAGGAVGAFNGASIGFSSSATIGELVTDDGSHDAHPEDGPPFADYQRVLPCAQLESVLGQQLPSIAAPPPGVGRAVC